MNENINANIEQQPTNATPAETGDQGEKLFTQADLDRIIGERLARAKCGTDNDYKALYEAAKSELESMKAAQLHQHKEDAYRALLAEAGIREKWWNTVMRASKDEIDALELDTNGKAVGSGKLVESIKTDWADFIPVTHTEGAPVAHPPVNTGGSSDPLADAFKPPKI